MRDFENVYDNSPMSASQAKAALQSAVSSIVTEDRYGETDGFGDVVGYMVTVGALEQISRMAADLARQINQSKGR